MPACTNIDDEWIQPKGKVTKMSYVNEKEPRLVRVASLDIYVCVHMHTHKYV